MEKIKTHIQALLKDIVIDNTKEQKEFDGVLNLMFQELNIPVDDKVRKQIDILVDGLGCYATRLINKIEKQLIEECIKS